MEFVPVTENSSKAEITFKNGYKVVVRQGTGTATTVGAPYELQCIPQNATISDDIIGYLTSEEITELMYEIQLLNKIS